MEIQTELMIAIIMMISIRILVTMTKTAIRKMTMKKMTMAKMTSMTLEIQTQLELVEPPPSSSHPS